MVIETSLQTRYLVQKLAIIVICVVLGLWGLYDYAVKIPQKQRVFQRGQICLSVKQALEAEPRTPAAGELREAAARRVAGEVDRLIEAGAQESGTSDPRQAIESIRKSDEGSWLLVLALFQTALQEAAQRPVTATPSQEFATAYDIAKRGVDRTAEISPPSRFDRMTQWAFILCLPFAPYYGWVLLRARSRRYGLDEDGTLHSPEGAWSDEEIANIDMSRWMSKSIATAVHADGRQVKLDDYVYRNMHLIVGEIASKRQPDEWTPEARRVKHDEEEAPAATDAAAEEADGPVEEAAHRS